MFPEDCSDNNDNLSHLNTLMAYKATTYPDSMYLNEAMHQEEKAEFLKAMLEEVRYQMENENFSIIKKIRCQKVALSSLAFGKRKENAT